MNKNIPKIVICLCTLVLLGAATSFAQHFPVEKDKETLDKALGKGPYSPHADVKYPTKPLFGDTHLHTGFSMDAGVWGCRFRPRDAYRSGPG